MISEDHPRSGSFSGDAGEAIHEWRGIEIEFQASSGSSLDGGEVEGTSAGTNGEELVGVLVDGMGLSDGTIDLDDQIDPLVVLGLQDELSLGDDAGVDEQ